MLFPIAVQGHQAGTVTSLRTFNNKDKTGFCLYLQHLPRTSHTTPLSTTLPLQPFRLQRAREEGARKRCESSGKTRAVVPHTRPIPAQHTLLSTIILAAPTPSLSAHHAKAQGHASPGHPLPSEHCCNHQPGRNHASDLLHTNAHTANSVIFIFLQKSI